MLILLILKHLLKKLKIFRLITLFIPQYLWTILKIILRMFYALENVASLVEKIILIGSGAEYISARYKPLMKENYFPNEPVYPVDIYTLSKYTISKLLSISNAKNIYNLRVFGIYGPYEDFQRRLISNNIVRYLNNLPLQYNRNVAFDYLYINDFLSALERFLSLEKPKYNTYNLCVGNL